MKPILSLLLLTFLSVPLAWADPLKNSWFTEASGQYARLYEDNPAMAALQSVTTWSRGDGSQAQPTYSGVSEVSFDNDYVYIRTSNLGFHIMGPWYNNGNLFPNFPANRAEVFRFPRTPTIHPVKDPTGGGTIGYFVDGVSMFDSRDAFSYSNGDGEDEDPGNRTTVNGDNVWLRDAYVNEGNTFDNANAHQAGSNYHYHANPPGLRHLLGDSVDYEFATNTYTENPNGRHSPIIGWCRDGLPIYGPYAYSDPTDSTSAVRRMISGYQKRDGTNGSTNLSVTGRTTLPQWVVRNDPAVTTTVLDPGVHGPPVDAVINNETYVLGRYLQDYAYKGDLTGLNLYEGVAVDGVHDPATDFDLNEHNVRWCVTPEFPGGTWAYFTNIEPDGTPKFPYNIARYYFADPVGDSPANVPANVTTVWEGGPEAPLGLREMDVDAGSGDVTITWSTVEGGQYVIESSDLTDPWTPIAAPLAKDSHTTIVDEGRASSDSSHFYRAEFQYLTPFDDAGFDYDNSILGDAPQNNVLLLILDDWGIDSSELYNSPGTGIQLADMPNLESLANAGLLFTRGYSQPICSPTRATILTGRQPYQHKVGNPGDDATLPATELTFPEIIGTEAPDYGLASFGKWHLGSGNTGPFDTGGWPNFSGTQAGGVPAYDGWTRIKIENGILVDSGTNVTDLVANNTYTSPYATSVQVDEAVSFINAQGSDPWVVWMGFNAPHDPFHDPEPFVTIPGGYSTSGTTTKDYYVKMLEALDHEVGRLLASVDLTKTNVIVVGDNGTPGQVDQPPVGGIAGAKGSLNEGGIHVPFFAAGPDVTVTGTSDKLVHVVDLFATILELARVNVGAATSGIEIHSRSLLPIFRGTDMEDRCVVAEKFGLNAATDGRSLIMDDWPDYKLISTQDVSDPSDVPSYQMYELGPDGVEIGTLTTPPAPGDPWEDAYHALVAKDQSMQPAASVVVTVDIDLPVNAPPLINPNNSNIVSPQAITIGGVPATWDMGTIAVNTVTTSAARVDENGDPDQLSVVAEFDLGSSGLTSGQSYPIVVTFPGGGGRDFTATNTFTVP